MSTTLTALAAIIIGSANPGFWQTDFEAAKRQSKAEGKPIILVFQGSDWCSPCMKLDLKVWSSPEFQRHASANYIMLQADFPRGAENALSEAQMEQNEALAERYNEGGDFPLVVVLDSSGKVLGMTGYRNAGPKSYIDQLDGFAAKMPRTKKPAKTGQIHKRSMRLMGCNFEITVVAGDAKTADGHIDAAVTEIRRIEALISSWDAKSQTSAINRNAGKAPTPIAPELFQLIDRSIALSQATDGAFDITYAALDGLWRFDGSMTRKPSDEALRAALMRVGFDKIERNARASTVRLKFSGMRIGFGAIGKGYAADRAKALLLKRGVRAGIINASGDMSAWGKQPSGKPWRVAITNPMNKNAAFALMPIHDGAVVTSGDYEKFVEIDGERHAHILDPRTGLPAKGLISVTVFAPKAELADALATSVFVMGVDAGLHRIHQIPGVEAILIDAKGSVITSKNIKLEAP